MAGKRVIGGAGRARVFPLSILQINTDRSVASHDMAYAVAAELSVDLIMAK